jgi:putative membrane protein
MIRIIAYAIGTIVATLVLAQISPRLIEFDSATTVVIFGLVVGVINAFIKPVVSIISLPITCLTFGAFAIVINAACFALGGWLTRTLTTESNLDISLWGAVFGSVLASLASGLIFSAVDER